MTNPNDKPIYNEGIDTSFWKRGLDYGLARDMGKVFVYPKASEGIFVDPSFVQHWKDSKQANFLQGGFHYFRAIANPLLQAQTFLGAFIGGEFNNGLGTLPPMLDVEWNPNMGYEADLDVPPKEWARRIKIWLEYVKKETWIKPGIYTSLYMWRKFVDPFGEETWAADYDLWIAHWDVPTPSLPKPFTKYVIHQYGLCDIGGMEIDANRFNGNNIFDWAQTLHIERTEQINGEIEEKRESWQRYAALKDEQYSRVTGG